jgi:DNA-binding transcriptional regulator YhcF (GntR family)
MLALSVDFDSEVPVYRQIVEEIRALIARGQLADGAELPSVRTLGARVGVNLNTVARAYRLLADEGLVDLRHGSRARVSIAKTPYREPPGADSDRRLHDVISRLVLAGEDKKGVERFFADALDRFFGSSAAKSKR